VTRRPHTDDLFELFPDLPWYRSGRPAAEQVREMRRQVDAWRRRAAVNIDRQRMAAARVRAALSARRYR
jgi:hypothetical protein